MNLKSGRARLLLSRAKKAVSRQGPAEAGVRLAQGLAG